MNKVDRDLLGITENNAWENIFSYSLLAAHSLDMTASALGKIDAEAARQIRMAQGMIRTRIDILVKEAFYTYREENGKKIRLKISSTPVEAFSGLQVACSTDTAKLQTKKEAGETRKDIAAAALALEGEKTEIAGALISNLVEIIQAELTFYRMPLKQAVTPISKDQDYLMKSLQVGALVISDLVHQAIERVRDKLEKKQDLYVCVNCGMLYYELPAEKCDTCESGQHLIVRYPFPIKGDLETMERHLYERYNPSPK